MCARFTQHHSPARITERFAPVTLELSLPPRYNIAPQQTITVVMQTGVERVADGMTWGLVPFWAKGPQSSQPLINARAESLGAKPVFRRSLQSQRCLIPADGFFEWTGPANRRQPVYFHLRGQELFAFAGIWALGQDGPGQNQRTCALITVPPNSLVAPVHNRMPAILRPEDESLWLNPAESDTDRLISILLPYPADAMDSRRVSPRMNSPQVDDVACIEPLRETELMLPGF
jgi:putative SOS response-associated peptidase YedK